MSRLGTGCSRVKSLKDSMVSPHGRGGTARGL